MWSSNCLCWKKCVKFDWEISCWTVKAEGKQSFKGCGLWLPAGVTGSGFAWGVARAARAEGAAGPAGTGGFSEWRTGQGWQVCSWSSLLLLEMFPLPGSFGFLLGCNVQQSQDSETEGETSAGFPCQVLLTHLLPTSEAHRWILDQSSWLISLNLTAFLTDLKRAGQNISGHTCDIFFRLWGKVCGSNDFWHSWSAVRCFSWWISSVNTTNLREMSSVCRKLCKIQLSVKGIQMCHYS